MGLDLYDIYDRARRRRRESYYPVSQIHDEIVIEAPVQTIVGHYYLHKERQRAVQVMGERQQVWTGGGYRWMYPVTDVTTGDEIVVERTDLGEELNDMEVIAWASR